MEKFIKGWDKKYSINDKGEVWSRYKYTNNGKRFYRDQLLVAYFNTLISKSPAVKLVEKKKITTVFVRSLMIEYFKLKAPDRYHQYVLQSKDGDNLNSSLSNLEWRIAVLNKEWLYYPQPFYDKKGKIVEKICGSCGSKLPISSFMLQDHRHRKGKICHKTYRNKCTVCISTDRWQQIKSDPKLYARYKEINDKYIVPERLKKKYRRTDQIRRDTLDPQYVKSTLCRYGILVADLTPQMIAIQAKSLALRRDYKSK